MKNKSKLFFILFFLHLVMKAISHENTVEDFIYPIPLHFEEGSKSFMLNKEIIFYFTYEKRFENFETFKEILDIYSDILNDQTEHSKDLKKQSKKVEIKIKIQNPIMKRYTNDYLTSYEEYNLTMTEPTSANRLIEIEIQSTYYNGLVHGLETLSQIISYDHENFSKSNYKILNLPIHIYDKPRFGYRGLMIDTSRHYISINKIKEIIRGLMYNKMNIFHWHITDDEYFGFGSEMLKITRYTYSKQEIKDIINYAEIRGITVILELDSPSHTRSWKDLYYNDKKISDLVLLKPEYGTLDPSNELTYKIVEDLIKEALALYHNNDGILIHLGGDEVLSDMWTTHNIIEFMHKLNINTTAELENYYFNIIRENLPTINSYIYWVSDQAKQIYDVYNSENSIMMYWGIHNNIKTFMDNFKDDGNNSNTAFNRKVILASGDFLYLDCGSGNKYGDETWCGGYKTWKTIYSFSVFENYKNFDIIGSEATLFAELADEYSIIGKIFPRINSLAEILWNDESKPKDIKKFFYRLLIHNKRLRSRGIEVISITSQLCEDNPDECIENIK